jgi:hypothetical protein
VVLEDEEAQRDETAYGGIVSVNWPFGVRTSFLGTANVERARVCVGHRYGTAESARRPEL